MEKYTVYCPCRGDTTAHPYQYSVMVVFKEPPNPGLQWKHPNSTKGENAFNSHLNCDQLHKPNSTPVGFYRFIPSKHLQLTNGVPLPETASIKE